MSNRAGRQSNIPAGSHGASRTGAGGGAGGGARGAGARPAGGFRGGGRHGARIESPTNFKAALGRMLRYFGNHWPSLIVVAVGIVASAGLKAIGPARIGKAIQLHIELNPDAAAFVSKMVIVLFIYVGAWIADILSNGFMARAGNKLIYRMRSDTFSHLQSLSMSYFDKKGLGDIISRVTNDTDMIYNALTNGFTSLLNGLFSIVGTLIAMVVLDIKLSLVVFAVLPLMIVITSIIGKMVRSAFRKNQMLIGMMSSRIAESVSAVKLIKSFHRESSTYKEFVKLSDQAREAGQRAEIVSFALHPIMRFINGFSLALVVGVGGLLAINSAETYSIGLITAFVLYARRFFEPLRQITNVYNLIQSALAGAERVFEILDTKPEITNADDATQVQDIKGDVSFNDVSFGYLPNQTVVEHIDIEAKSGQVVAIVGPTGAGKTTLVNLLSRFYDTDSGTIYIDGNDIKKLDVDSLRTRMGVVLQEPYFFATSIMDNIKYGRPGATDEEAIKAASLAKADTFIRRLPEGYDTVLQERGMNLSQGERQLLAIARAILADPRILILDEATSSVDSLTEVLIQRGLLELMKGRTSFIIAHRLSTIRNADQVIVLHERKVIERGTHTELMEKDGFYARLYRLQFERPEITENMKI